MRIYLSLRFKSGFNSLDYNSEMTVMPKLTSDNNRITLLRLIDFNAANLNIEKSLTAYFMTYDVLNKTPEADRLADGEVIIFDLHGITARHLTIFGVSAIRCFLKYLIDSHPLRIKQIHILNARMIVHKLVWIFRPFMGKQAFDVIHFHKPKSTTLYEFVPKELLPEDYGGPIESMKKLSKRLIERCEGQR